MLFSDIIERSKKGVVFLGYDKNLKYNFIRNLRSNKIDYINLPIDCEDFQSFIREININRVLNTDDKSGDYLSTYIDVSDLAGGDRYKVVQEITNLGDNIIFGSYKRSTLIGMDNIRGRVIFKNIKTTVEYNLKFIYYFTDSGIKTIKEHVRIR